MSAKSDVRVAWVSTPSGELESNTSLGKRNPREYKVWLGMRDRCFNKRNHAYPRYGGRGVTICERWASFAKFLEDMGKRPEGKSIDRINNDGNYEPSNCRWATPQEQSNNRRPRPFVDLTGKRFGRLVVLGQRARHRNYISWLFKCDCGEEKRIGICAVKGGTVVSCGCRKRENLISLHDKRARARKTGTIERAW